MSRQNRRRSATRPQSRRELLSERHDRVPECVPLRRDFVTLPENRPELSGRRLGVGELEQAIVESVVLGIEGQRIHAEVRKRIVCAVAGATELGPWVMVASLRCRHGRTRWGQVWIAEVLVSSAVASPQHNEGDRAPS